MSTMGSSAGSSRTSSARSASTSAGARRRLWWPGVSTRTGAVGATGRSLRPDRASASSGRTRSYGPASLARPPASPGLARRSAAARPGTDSRRVDPVRTFTPHAADITRELARHRRRRRVLGRLATEIAHAAARQAQADLGAARRHRRPRDRGERARSSRSRPQKATRTSSTTATPATRAVSSTETLEHLMARDPERVVRLAVRGMLPKGPLGRQMLKKLQDLRRPDAPAPRAAAGRHRCRARPCTATAKPDALKGLHVPKPLIQTTGRRKEAVARVRLRPGTGKIIGQRPRRSTTYFPILTAPGDRQGAAAAHADRRGLRRRRDARRRRRQRPGRRHPARHRPGARRARPRDPAAR